MKSRSPDRRVGGGAEELVGSGEEPRPFAWPLGHRSLLQGGKPSTPISTPSPSTQTSSRSIEQPLDGALGLLVASFADMVVADDAVGVDEVQRRPVVVVEGAPNCVVVVDRDRVVDPSLGGRLPDAADLMLERELWGVDADDDHPVVSVGLRPGADVRLSA
jgi:hypothetical protein